MTVKEIEEKVIELIHREPFVPFVVEMKDGTSLVIPHAKLALDENGAGFIGMDGALIDFEFTAVRAIRPCAHETVA